ncbi:unnamed protein product [Ixodes hexagonus]
MRGYSVSRGNAASPPPPELGARLACSRQARRELVADRRARPGLRARTLRRSSRRRVCGCGARSPVVTGGDGERRPRRTVQPVMAAVRRRRRRGAWTDNESSDHSTPPKSSSSSSSPPSRWR